MTRLPGLLRLCRVIHVVTVLRYRRRIRYLRHNYIFIDNARKTNWGKL